MRFCNADLQLNYDINKMNLGSGLGLSKYISIFETIISVK